MIEFNSDTLVLTANRRLAESIQQNYVKQQRGKNRPVWETPKILPLQTWLQMLWRTHFLGPEQLLTDIQEKQLWSQIIQETSQTLYPLLQVDNTAALAQQAWQFLHHWQVSLNQINSAGTSAEVSLFAQWAAQFMQQCQRRQWLSEAVLPERLQMAVGQQRVSLPKQILMAGFDELTPAYQSLMKSLSPQTTIRHLEIAHSPGKNYQHRFADNETEIKQMAEWAKAQYSQNPQQAIGCVSLQFAEQRPRILRIFQQVFAPENQLPGATASALPYNISGGQSLNEFEIISVALQILTLGLEKKISVDSLGQLLQSAYLCQNETDFDLGAQLDVECRRSGCFELPFAALFTAISRWHVYYPEQSWLQRFRAYAAVEIADNALQLPSAWTKHFIQQLNALGWPGGRSLTSIEYQIMERWQELLAEFAELDLVAADLSYSAALHCLQRLSAQTLFQPKTPANAPIQILGVLESSGFYFDALWIMGLDDQHWPPPAQPNPFLPYSLQIALQMPHASSQRELVYSQQITQRLLGSAQQIWLSCSATAPDQPARLSRLVPRSSLDSSLRWNDTLTYAETIFNSAQKETILDQNGPSIALTEKIRGGSGILTKQAECPFRAFAMVRLNAVALPEPVLGISPLTHGVLIHDVLERVWKKLKTQQNLLALDSAELLKILENIVDRVIQDSLPEAESVFAQIERNRLVAITRDWLALEKKRPPFSVVEQETERLLDLSGLRLHLKIDRIDQLSNGSHLLIDYKTGRTDIKTWLDERLQQPQLPLYALDPDHYNDFSGVAFAQLHIGELKFKGLHDESLDTESFFPAGMISIDTYKDLSAPRSWPELLTHWREVLAKLSVDFQAGYAAVDPADEGAPCKTCDLQMLCRINSMRTVS